MIKYIQVAVLNLLMLFSLSAFSQKENTNTEYDLYLLIGQSNMSGRGVITEKNKEEGRPNVFMLTKENTWVPARNPLHFDKPKIAGVGPGLSFGISMAKGNPTHKIGLVPCAVGGTSIDSWKPGGYDKATNTNPYDASVPKYFSELSIGKVPEGNPAPDFINQIRETLKLI